MDLITYIERAHGQHGLIRDVETGAVFPLIGGGDGGDAPSPPPPTPEERALQREQAEMLREQRDLMRQYFAQQELLAPFVYEQLGLRPVYGRAEEEYQKLVSERDSLAAQLSKVPSVYRQGSTNPLQQNQAAKFKLPNGMTISEAEKRLADLESQISNFSKQEITGFEKMAPEDLDPLYAQKKEIEKLTLDRSLAALKGELPVNPALLTDLERQEEMLRETLRRELGPGFEVSTPGIRRLEEFGLRKNQILDAARRGDLTLAEQLNQAREAHNLGVRQQNFNFMNQPFLQAANLASNATALGTTLVNSGLNYFQHNRAMELQAAIEAARNRNAFTTALIGGVGSTLGTAVGIGAASGMFAKKGT